MVKKAPGRASFGLVAGRVLLRGFLCGVTGQAAQAPEGQSGLGTAWSVLATSVPLGHLAVGCTLSLGTKAAALTIPGPACSVSTAQMPAGVSRCPGDPRVERQRCAATSASVSSLPVRPGKRAAGVWPLLSLHPSLEGCSPYGPSVTARPCSAELLGARVPRGLHLARGLPPGAALEEAMLANSCCGNPYHLLCGHSSVSETCSLRILKCRMAGVCARTELQGCLLPPLHAACFSLPNFAVQKSRANYPHFTYSVLNSAF